MSDPVEDVFVVWSEETQDVIGTTTDLGEWPLLLLPETRKEAGIRVFLFTKSRELTLGEIVSLVGGD